MSRFAETGNWHGMTAIPATKFICGHCDTVVKSDRGFHAEQKVVSGRSRTAKILICPGCSGPNIFDGEDTQIPGALYGNSILHLPEEIQYLYKETRMALGASAFTASVLAARKILMNFAVHKGAEQGKTFQHYVDYIVDNHYSPPNSKDWVDHIRNLGNEATHEIAPKRQDDAILLLEFLEMILKMNYEFPGRLPKAAKP